MRNPGHLEIWALFSCMAGTPITSPLSKLKRRVDYLEAAQGAPRDPRRDSGGERILCVPSRRGLTPRGSLECNPEIPAFPGEEYEVPDTRLGEVSSALQ